MPKTAWTDVQDLRAQTRKLWDKGALLAELVSGQTCFPQRLRLQAPSNGELASRFEEARNWANELRVSPAHAAGHYRLVERLARSPVLGNNRIPDEAWLDSLASALALIGKTSEAARFSALVASTREQQPALLAWLEKRPLAALDLLEVWPRLLAAVNWLQQHPRPGIYLRQVDIAGVDSKFMESWRSVLAELLDLTLPPQAIDSTASGASRFCQRYGFLDKPLRVRFRLLDPQVINHPELLSFGADISTTQAAFEQLDLPVDKVFVTENEVNFLSFPPVPRAIVVFGGGFGLDSLRNASWLHLRRVFYWGDLDTHGFAILDQLRAYLPKVQSIMMDTATLMQHREHWGHEAQAQQRDLPRLRADEAAVYDLLRDNRIRPGLRLEQERIGFGWVQQALAVLHGMNGPDDVDPAHG